MARPIKETPILYGEEARKFEMRMLNPTPVSQDREENRSCVTTNFFVVKVLTVVSRAKNKRKLSYFQNIS